MDEGFVFSAESMTIKKNVAWRQRLKGKFLLLITDELPQITNELLPQSAVSHLTGLGFLFRHFSVPFYPYRPPAGSEETYR